MQVLNSALFNQICAYEYIKSLTPKICYNVFEVSTNRYQLLALGIYKSMCILWMISSRP